MQRSNLNRCPPIGRQTDGHSLIFIDFYYDQTHFNFEYSEINLSLIMKLTKLNATQHDFSTMQIPNYILFEWKIYVSNYQIKAYC